MKINFFFQKKPKPEEVKISPEPKQGEQIIEFNSALYGRGTFTLFNEDDLLIKKGNSIYRKMMRDDQIKASLALKKSSVLARSYSFDLDDDNEDQQKIADFFWAILDNMKGSFSDKIMGILTGLENGFSISEKVYAPFTWEGKTYWGVSDIKLKPFDSFTFEVDAFGNIQHLSQTALMGSTDKIPMNKVIHWVHQSNVDRCYGESDLRAIYKNWWSKDINIKLQNIFLERFAGGLAIMKENEQAATDTNTKTKLINIVKNLSARTGIYLPKGYELEVIQPSTTDAYTRAISMHDKAIARGLLLPNLLGFAEQDTGSYAQSQIQFTAYLDLVVEKDCKSIEECLNEQLFPELALWNFGTANFPKFRFDPMTKASKAELAKTWTQLVKDGSVTNGDRDEAYTRELLGYPEKEEEEEPENALPEIPEDMLPPEEPEGPEEPEEPVIEEDPDIAERKKAEFAETGNKWLKRVNFTELKKNFDRGEEKYLLELTELMAQVKFSLQKQITKIVGGRSLDNVNPKEFDSLSIPKGMLTKIRKLTRTALQEVAEKAGQQALKEVPKKFFAKPVYGTKLESFLTRKSLNIAQAIEMDVLKNMSLVLDNGMKKNASLKEIMLDLENTNGILQYLPGKIDNTGKWIRTKTVDAEGAKKLLTPARLEVIARTNIADAVNQSRKALFESDDLKDFILAYGYSAILDTRISDVCERLHGRVRKDWGPLTPPNHYGCRSVIIPVTVIDDWSGKEDNIPTGIAEQVNKSGF